MMHGQTQIKNNLLQTYVPLFISVAKKPFFGEKKNIEGVLDPACPLPTQFTPMSTCIKAPQNKQFELSLPTLSGFYPDLKRVLPNYSSAIL